MSENLQKYHTINQETTNTQIYNRNNNGCDDNNDDDDSDDDSDDDDDNVDDDESDGDDESDELMIVTCLVNEPDNIVFPNCTLSMLI